MIQVTRRQFLAYLASIVVMIKLPSSAVKPSESTEELAMRLWRHPTLSYWYSEDGKNWRKQVYHNITLPFSDGIVTLDSNLTTTKIFEAFRAARKKVTYFEYAGLGIDWPRHSY